MCMLIYIYNYLHMKNKIISFIIWVLVWWVLVFWYWSLNGNNQPSWQRGVWGPNAWAANMDVSTMTDEQLEQMATRAWITLEELKEKLESWENIRDIMPANNRGERQRTSE